MIPCKGMIPILRNGQVEGTGSVGAGASSEDEDSAQGALAEIG